MFQRPVSIPTPRGLICLSIARSSTAAAGTQLGPLSLDPGIDQRIPPQGHYGTSVQDMDRTTSTI